MTATTYTEIPTAKTEITTGLNSLFTAGIIASILLQLIVLPLYLLPMNLNWAWLILPLGLLTPMMWGLIHEAIHGLLNPEKKLNEYLGRALAILFGASFHVLTYGHLMHHRLNRHWESEYYDPSKPGAWKKKIAYYAHLLGGLYVLEVASSIAFAFFPQTLGKAIIRNKAQDEPMRIAGERYFLKPERITKMRTDMGLVIAIYTVSMLLYGAYWPYLLLVVGLRALIVSMLDNIYHYGTPTDNSIAAYEVSVSKPLGMFLLNMNHHNTHHRNALIPWAHLPKRFDQNRGIFEGTFLRSLFGQFLGPQPLMV